LIKIGVDIMPLPTRENNGVKSKLQCQNPMLKMLTKSQSCVNNNRSDRSQESFKGDVEQHSTGRNSTHHY
jgi:hypothetical protein